jgi:Gpi18-like mannosyltransferase
MTRRVLLALSLLAYLGLRGALLFVPGYEDDLKAYRRWALSAARHGIASVYRESDMDYPPLYAYVLAPLGRAYLALVPSELARRPRGDMSVWTPLAKLPPLAFDLLTAALLALIVRRELGPGSGFVVGVPAAYLLNPAVVFDTGVWGHPDSIHSFFVLAAFACVGSRLWLLSWPALALATMMKPLGAPFAPLLLAAGLWRDGWRRSFVGLVAGTATAALLFAPFLAAGEGRAVLERIAGDIDRMPFTSVNAHNLWWALGPWRAAEDPLLGPLTATQMGLLLFAAVYALVLRRLGARMAPGTDTQELLGLASLVAVSFFMLATHMHENHLFAALPLFSPLLTRGPRQAWLFAALSLGVLANLMLHDQAIPGGWPFTLGGETTVPRPSHGRVFFAAELAAVRLAVAFNLAVFAALLATLRGPTAAPAPLQSGPRKATI